MEKVKVLRMTKEDVEDVFHIEELIHPNHHWSKDSFYNEIANNLAYYYCVKNENDKILAYIGVWQILEEAHVTTLGVHPDFRGLQLAQILLIQALKDCYKNMIKYVTLEVRESNVLADTANDEFFSESLRNAQKNYQDNGENALIMFTQNIWYDTFKNNFNNLVSNISKVAVNYAE